MEASTLWVKVTGISWVCQRIKLGNGETFAPKEES
jgi:hypothetical protein